MSVSDTMTYDKYALSAAANCPPAKATEIAREVFAGTVDVLMAHLRKRTPNRTAAAVIAHLRKTSRVMAGDPARFEREVLRRAERMATD